MSFRHILEFPSEMKQCGQVYVGQTHNFGKIFGKSLEEHCSPIWKPHKGENP